MIKTSKEFVYTKPGSTGTVEEILRSEKKIEYMKENTWKFGIFLSGYTSARL